MQSPTRSVTHDPSLERSDSKSETTGGSNQRSLQLFLPIAVTLAILIRTAVLYFGAESLKQDPDAYQAIAITIHEQGVFGLTAADGQVIPTSFRPPLYPWMLSAVVNEQGNISRLAIAALHLLLGVMTACLTFLSVRYLLTINRPADSMVNVASFVGATLVAIDPILVQQSTFVMTETLAACLTSLIFWIWIRSFRSGPTIGLSVLRGVALSTAFLCRPTFLAWAVLLLMGEIVIAVFAANRQKKQSRGATALSLCITAGILLLTVAAWTKRNASSTGYPAWATTHGGYTLLLGNNPLFYEHLESGGAFKRWDADSFTQAYAYRFGEEGQSEDFWLKARDPSTSPQPPPLGLTEHQDDQWSYRAAIATIKRSPQTFVTASFNRLYRLWTPLPFGTSDRTDLKRIAITAYYLFLYFLAVIGIIKIFRNGQSRLLLPLLSLLLALSVIHTIYWSNLRMRAPALPLIAVYASLSIGSIPVLTRQRKIDKD